MRAIVMSLQKSGTRMMLSLLSSHPKISCGLDRTDVDVGAFHFYNIKWEWLVDSKVKKILLVRNYINGAISEMVSPHGERASGQYTLSQRSVTRLAQRRQLQTELLMPYADLVIDFTEECEKLHFVPDGPEAFCYENDTLCDLLEINRQALASTMKALPKIAPRNLEELRAGTIC